VIKVAGTTAVTSDTSEDVARCPVHEESVLALVNGLSALVNGLSVIDMVVMVWTSCPLVWEYCGWGH
jgi:hypothetical protein